MNKGGPNRAAFFYYIYLMNQQPSKAARLIGVTILLAIIACIGYWMFSPSEPDKFQPTATTALVDSRPFIEKQLKAPATAEFSNDPSGVKQLNDTTFIVQSFVDSENGFGANIRSNYSCKITYLNGTTYTCEDITIE